MAGVKHTSHADVVVGEHSRRGLHSSCEDAPVRLIDLPGTIGTEVLDVDLAAGNGVDPSWSSTDMAALRTTLDDRKLLLARGPVLAGEAQIAFVSRFGPLVPERALWGYVSNTRADGIVREGPLLFHSDFAFTAHPVSMISLHALEVPADGAPTIWADAVAAVDHLPADLRARLEGVRVVNCFDLLGEGDHRMRLAELDPRASRVEHPVIAPHPRTGRPVVMANAMHTDSIVGLPEAESEALLTDLFAVLYDPSNLYEHRWSVGDLVLWDNVALHHARGDLGSDEPRTLQRVTVGDYTPSELIDGLAGLLAEKHGRA